VNNKRRLLTKIGLLIIIAVFSLDAEAARLAKEEYPEIQTSSDFTEIPLVTKHYSRLQTGKEYYYDF
jgi:hypothetical protein